MRKQTIRLLGVSAILLLAVALLAACAAPRGTENVKETGGNAFAASEATPQAAASPAVQDPSTSSILPAATAVMPMAGRMGNMLAGTPMAGTMPMQSGGMAGGMGRMGSTSGAMASGMMSGGMMMGGMGNSATMTGTMQSSCPMMSGGMMGGMGNSTTMSGTMQSGYPMMNNSSGGMSGGMMCGMSSGTAMAPGTRMGGIGGMAGMTGSSSPLPNSGVMTGTMQAACPMIQAGTAMTGTVTSGTLGCPMVPGSAQPSSSATTGGAPMQPLIPTTAPEVPETPTPMPGMEASPEATSPTPGMNMGTPTSG